jgi:DNA polymerase-3 subunit delta'
MVFQSDLFDKMKMIHSRGRWPSTTLLLDSEGYGALNLFLSLSKLLFCEYDNSGYCGSCSDCKRIDRFEHPNIIFEFPVYGSSMQEQLLGPWREFVIENQFGNAYDWMKYLNKPTSKPNITAANCRAFSSRLQISSLENKKKIALIWESQFLGKEGNILLKTIEEPPSNTYIFLIANRKEALLNTIRSRCQVFQLLPVREDALSRYLTEAHGLSSAQSDHLAFLSDGSPKKALEWLEKDSNEAALFFVEFLRKSYRGDPAELKNITEEAQKLGKNFVRSAFHFGLSYIESMLRLSCSGNEYQLRLDEEIERSAQKLSYLTDLSKLKELSDLVERLILGIQRNANVKMIMFHSALEINRILRRKSN